MEKTRQSRPDDVPPVLYKYISWREHKNYEHNLLVDNTAYFASAKDFNDPFDCDVKLRIDLANEDVRKDHGKVYIKTVYPNLPRAARRRIMNFKEFADKFRKPEYKAECENTIRNYLYTKIGIFCMSEVKDNILMWAHYSDAHQGLCLGFDMERFQDYCLRQYDDAKNIMMGPQKVKYMGEYPLLIPSMEDYGEMAVEQVLIKASDWKHEREYRVLFTGGSGKILILDDDIISEVIIGCRMDNADQEEVKDILSKRAYRPKLFKAEPNAESFGLDIVPVDY